MAKFNLQGVGTIEGTPFEIIDLVILLQDHADKQDADKQAQAEYVKRLEECNDQLRGEVEQLVYDLADANAEIDDLDRAVDEARHIIADLETKQYKPTITEGVLCEIKIKHLENCLSGFDVGDLVEVVQIDEDDDTYKYRVSKDGGDVIGWARFTELKVLF